jgi:hypothetical protein
VPTILESFILQIKLDPSGFKKGQEQAEVNFRKVKDEARKSGKEIEGANKAIGETFAKARNEALGFFAVLLGARGIKEFLGDVTTADAALGRFSANMNVPLDVASGWGKAVERIGGDAKDATASIATVTKALFEVHQKGQKLPIDLFLLMQGNKEHGLAEGKMDWDHGTDQFMNDIAAQAKKRAAFDRSGTYQLLMGLGLTDSVANVMMEHGSETGAYVKSLGDSLGPTKEAISAAADLQSKWAEVQQTVEAIGHDSLPALDKSLSPILDKMTKFLADFRGDLKSPDSKFLGIFGPGFGTQYGNPLGDWLKKELGIGAKADELPPGFDEGDFESRRGHALSGLTVEGQSVSRGNPLPVDIVRTSLSQQAISDPNALLGGAEGSGGPLPTTPQGGAGAPDSFRSRGRGGAGLHDRPPVGSAGTGEPGIPYGAGSLTKEAGISQEQYDAFREGVTDLEGKAYGHMGGAGGRYAGRYQMGPSEITETASRLGVPRPTNAAFLADKQMQEKFFENYTLDHYRSLMMSPTFRGMSHEQQLEILGYAHNQGVGGALHYLRTGQAGRDGWGTSGARYIDAIRRREAAIKAHHNAPAWWSGVPLSQNGAPTGGARLSSMAAGRSVTSSQTSNAIHIGKIDVNAPHANDAHGIASELMAALSRSTAAMMAQSGQV